ncbi:MATE family efflux transporter [Draconibacterium orientale]|uniref:MATE family efflux transporter n=1 Tax=Draconibacterium orientale TaxID=1168034 RepID=UPI002A0A5F0C|nr:MATE family efflux transporter [Draconibacterium orientale]
MGDVKKGNIKQHLMSPAERVAVNTGILYARMGITIFITLFVTRIILDSLGAEDFGIFNLIAGAIAMLTFLNTAMAGASQRFMSYAQGEGDIKKQKYIFNVSIILHLSIAILVIIIIEIAGYFLFKGVLSIPEGRLHAAKVIYQFMLVSTFFTIISVPYDAIINAHENMLFVAILSITETIFKLAIAIFVSYTSSDKLISYGLLMALISIVLLFIRQIYCHRKYVEVQIHPKRYFKIPLFMEMTSYAGWALLCTTTSIVTMQGMSILLNTFFGVIVNAAQGIANQISGLLMSFSNTMLKALNPVIVKSEGGKNRELMLKASLTGNKISFYLYAFFAIPTIIEMPFLLSIWLKETPDFAIIFCRLSLFKTLIQQPTITFYTSIAATGKVKPNSIVDSILWSLLLPISYVAFRMGSTPEVIYINLIILALSLTLSKIYFVYRIVGLPIRRIFKDTLIPCFIVAVISTSICIIPNLLLSEGLLRFFSVAFLNSVAFLTLTFFVGLNDLEKKQFTLIVNSVFFKVKTICRTSFVKI